MTLLTLTGVIVRYPTRFTNYIEKYSQEFNVDFHLVQAVIWTESKMRPNAVSHAGAVGLMQLMPSTAKWVAEKLGVEFSDDKLFEPDFNIKIGTFYLSFLLERFDTQNALAAYNAGQANVFRWIAENRSEIPFRETRDFVQRVNRAKRVYQFLN
ncbi:MAG: lytic transglycosylase domain-containing protein [Firmicutes bacterium]|nr:lytic transglycosylase domain-containing protein [Bacillota bacterium]